MIAAPPGETARTVPVLPIPVAFPLVPVPVTVATAGSEVLQVSGTFVKVAFRVSTTVAVIVLLPPVASVNALLAEFVTASVIDFTGQVAKFMAGLFTPAAFTKICVIPGTLAVACAWFAPIPLTVLLTLTMVLLSAVQVSGPTVAVMSFPRLETVAW